MPRTVPLIPGSAALKSCPASLFEVRPGQSRGEVAHAIARDDRDFDLAALTLPGADPRVPVQIGFDDSGRVESVTYRPGIPATMKLDGLHIGLALDDMTHMRPDLREVRNYAPVRTWRALGPYATEATIADGTVVRIAFYALAIMDGILAWEAEEAERYRILAEESARKNRWKTLADPDAMLDAWAEVATCWGSADDRFCWLAGRLRAATPDEWHAFALEWNWDHGLAPLAWIVRQTDCDRATAAHVYWGLEPAYFATNDWRKPGEGFSDDFACATALDIARRWDAGLYRRSQIAWQPPTHVQRYDLAKLRTPPGMAEAMAGRVLDAGLFRRDVPPQYRFE